MKGDMKSLNKLEKSVKNGDWIKAKNLLIVTITAEFGSDFQQEFGENSLMTMLKAWKYHMESAHKKNSISIIEEEN